MANDRSLLSRRQFLVLSLGATTTLAVPALVGCSLQRPPPPEPTTVPGTGPSFMYPTTIASVNGVLSTSLLIKPRTFTIPGEAQPLTLHAYGSPRQGVANPDPNNDGDWVWTFPAPTFLLNAGDRIRLKLYNYLPVQSPVDACEPANYPAAPTPTDHYPNCYHENNVTNVHFHGLHVDQGPHADDVFLALYPNGQSPPPPPQHGEIIAVGSYDFDFVVPKTHPQGTFWYHPHKHGSSDVQIANGMAGAIIVADSLATDPAFQGHKLTDYVLVIQSIKQALTFPNPSGAGTQLLNNQATPTIMMKAGEVQRWRLVNATGQAATTFNIAFDMATSQAPNVYPIAVDGIFFDNAHWDARTPANAAYMAPGNRVDVLVQAVQEGTFRLRASRVQANQLRRNEHPQNLSQATVADQTYLVDVTVQGTLSPPMGLPAQLPALPHDLRPIPDSEIVKKRQITFSIQTDTFQGKSPVFLIDGKLFDPCVVNHCVLLDTAEEWTIVNRTTVAHPFHIHLNPFFVTAIHDPSNTGETTPILPPNDPRRRWQDTIIIPACEPDPSNSLLCKLDTNGQAANPGFVTIRQRFPDLTGKFVLHCHILGHEDRGMMQVVQVARNEAECEACH